MYTVIVNYCCLGSLVVCMFMLLTNGILPQFTLRPLHRIRRTNLRPYKPTLKWLFSILNVNNAHYAILKERKREREIKSENGREGKRKKHAKMSLLTSRLMEVNGSSNFNEVKWMSISINVREWKHLITHHQQQYIAQIKSLSMWKWVHSFRSIIGCA